MQTSNYPFFPFSHLDKLHYPLSFLDNVSGVERHFHWEGIRGVFKKDRAFYLFKPKIYLFVYIDVIVF